MTNSDKAIREVLDISKGDGLPTNHDDADIAWLITQIREDSLGGVVHRAEALINRAVQLNNKGLLPHTHAIFGSWGAGKTHLLAELYSQIMQKHLPYEVVYFNAFKYASYSDFVPALIYKLLRLLPNESFFEKLLNEAEQLSKRHIPKLYSAGLASASFCRSVLTITNDVPAQNQLEMYKEFYGKVDSFQNLLAKALSEVKGPIIVMIDELDRCDPIEAFDAIKQLRLLFCMQKIPVYFILSVNPDPIGKAIQKEFGLSDEDEYESLRILEKFVDTSSSIATGRNLAPFVHDLWKRNELNLQTHSTVLEIDSIATGKPYIPASISQKHPLYTNLRLLEKNLIAATIHSSSTHLWTRWHIEILKARDSEFRKDVASVAGELRRATEGAMVALLQGAHSAGGVNSGRLNVKSGQNWNATEQFVQHFREQLPSLVSACKSSNRILEGETLDTLRLDAFKLAFLSNLCLVDLGRLIELQITSTFNVRNPNLADSVSNSGATMDDFQHILETA